MGERGRTQRRYLSSNARNALLVAHIMISVGLLGDTAGFLTLALRASNASDPAAATELVRILQLFAFLFGIPLSFGALITGAALGLGTKWGVFQYPWVIAKLTLIVSVMAVGGVVIGPALNTMLAGGTGESGRLIAAAAYDVVALAVATGLSVFKPGKRLR